VTAYLKDDCLKLVDYPSIPVHLSKEEVKVDDQSFYTVTFGKFD